MSKKVIGALLAIVMVLSVFSFTVFAAGDTKYEATGNEYTQIWGLRTNGNKIDVVLTTDYAVGPISFQIEGVASIDSVELGAGYYAGSTIDRAEDGTILIFPITGAATPLKGVQMNEAVIASFTYTKDASNATPSIKNNPKGNTTDTVGGKLMATRLSGEYVDYSDFYVGQKNVTIYALDADWEDVPVTPPAGGDDVTLTGINGAVVDTANGYVYGVPAGTADVKTYFSTTGYIEMTASELNATNGTGAKLNLYTDSSKATLVASYTLIIFGDVNGDGAIDVNDSVAVGKHVSSTLSITSAIYLFAADVNEPGATPDVNVNDLNALNKHVSSTLLLSSNVRAA